MGFGFSDKEEEEDKDDGPKFEFSWADCLKIQKWESLSVETRVRSILTGTMGTINKLQNPYSMIGIVWDNGKISFDRQVRMGNVVIIKAT